MNPQAMVPFGLALRGYDRGDTAAQVTVRRDDGLEIALPAGHFFRSPQEFSSIEVAAIERCRGRVLDVGAGTGIHSLWLQSKGLSVTALDVDPHAVDIMARRGVANVRCGDVFRFSDGVFDTLLLLGHGIGMVEDLDGLARFLSLAHRLADKGGQLLVHTVDVRQTNDPGHMAYHEANRRQGRYIGEIRLQCEYEGRSGPFYRWLHVDPETLNTHATRAGWRSQVVCAEERGEYLAQLMTP